MTQGLLQIHSSRLEYLIPQTWDTNNIFSFSAGRKWWPGIFRKLFWIFGNRFRNGFRETWRLDWMRWVVPLHVNIGWGVCFARRLLKHDFSFLQADGKSEGLGCLCKAAASLSRRAQLSTKSKSRVSVFVRARSLRRLNTLPSVQNRMYTP